MLWEALGWVYAVVAVGMLLVDFRRSQSRSPLAVMLALVVFCFVPLWRLLRLLVRFYRVEHPLDAGSLVRSRRASRSVRVLRGGRVFLVVERDGWHPVSVTRMRNCTVLCVHVPWGLAYSWIFWDVRYDVAGKQNPAG